MKKCVTFSATHFYILIYCIFSLFTKNFSCNKKYDKYNDCNDDENHDDQAPCKMVRIAKKFMEIGAFINNFTCFGVRI